MCLQQQDHCGWSRRGGDEQEEVGSSGAGACGPLQELWLLLSKREGATEWHALIYI